jgi:hypothetical protein
MDEVVGYGLLFMVLAGCMLAVLYMLSLTAFFKELRQREPNVWEQIGSPTLPNMLLRPLRRSRKYYAFLPVLKARRHSNYRDADRAWFLLRTGLIYVATLFLLAGVQASLLE